jgi:hypothetical protein
MRILLYRLLGAVRLAGRLAFVGKLRGSDLSFENFRVDEGSRLAHAAALTVAEFPGVTYKPVDSDWDDGFGKDASSSCDR